MSLSFCLHRNSRKENFENNIISYLMHNNITVPSNFMVLRAEELFVCLKRNNRAEEIMIDVDIFLFIIPEIQSSE